MDIQVSVADPGAEPAYAPPLQRTGLELRSRDDLHRYFRPPAGQPREVHVHVCAAGGTWEHDHLLFRDYLRAHPAACLRYAEAKQAIAQRWGDDSWAYTGAKTGVILDILEQAGEWALATRRRRAERRIRPPAELMHFFPKRTKTGRSDVFVRIDLPGLV